MEPQSFDLIVIGTGMGGMTAAEKCRGAGWDVAIIDSRPFGGTCALRGCDPKKVLVGAAELVDWSQRMKGNGIKGGFELDWADLMAFKDTFTEPVPDRMERMFSKKGIKTFHGRAAFTGEQTLKVNNQSLSADFILLANGSKPAPLPIDGFEYLTNSTRFLELQQLPDNIIFVGGGYISFEFAHITSRTGAGVHILHRGEQPLERFEKDITDILLEKSGETGINVSLRTEVTSVAKNEKGFKVFANKDGQKVEFQADLVVHGAGRVPDIDDLELDKGEVESSNGVKVNRFLQSESNPHVYSVGDAVDTEGLPLTPVAAHEAHIAASNMLKGNSKTPNYKAQPTVVFTIPPIASVGLSEQQATEQGYEVDINFRETSSWYTSKRVNEQYSGFKTVIEKETGRILGAHLIGEHSDEIINLFALAIKFNLSSIDLKKMIYTYPSRSSDIAYML